MKSYITSTIFRKGLASLSGLFLITFLIGHLAGNLQLFIPGVEGQTQFNKYALFMTTNPIIKILSFITYFAVLLHIAITLYLVIQSKKARPLRYAVTNNKENSTWSSGAHCNGDARNVAEAHCGRKRRGQGLEVRHFARFIGVVIIPLGQSNRVPKRTEVDETHADRQK